MEPSPEAVKTKHLLSELDFAIEQLNAMRDIVSRYERLHKLESITGPTRRTRIMRREIEIMENRFNCARNARETDPLAITR